MKWDQSHYTLRIEHCRIIIESMRWEVAHCCCWNQTIDILVLILCAYLLKIQHWLLFSSSFSSCINVILININALGIKRIPLFGVYLNQLQYSGNDYSIAFKVLSLHSTYTFLICCHIQYTHIHIFAIF